jgi:hypothetical protein
LLAVLFAPPATAGGWSLALVSLMGQSNGNRIFSFDEQNQRRE